jgi:hypothetical protein
MKICGLRFWPGEKAASNNLPPMHKLGYQSALKKVISPRRVRLTHPTAFSTLGNYSPNLKNFSEAEWFDAKKGPAACRPLSGDSG